jgi:hypothetical protein
MMFHVFEQRCRNTPDLALTWVYWNALLPETTGRALFWLFVWPALRSLKT